MSNPANTPETGGDALYNEVVDAVARLHVYSSAEEYIAKERDNLKAHYFPKEKFDEAVKKDEDTVHVCTRQMAWTDDSFYWVRKPASVNGQHIRRLSSRREVPISVGMIVCNVYSIGD